MFKRIKGWFTSTPREEELQSHLEAIKERMPVPVIWLFGKTQSGKTTIVRALTGATNAEIGKGFRPCTRFSQQYQFPTDEAPLITFLDTRGLDEPGYDPTEDLARFNEQAHLVLVVCKALDHAQRHVLEHLDVIRESQSRRPVLLALTCLHEAYPQQQHPQPYPFGTGDLREWIEAARADPPATTPPLDQSLLRSLQAQLQQFGSLVDRGVAIDITPEEEGFDDPNYGRPALQQAVQELLPDAMSQTLIQVDRATNELRDFHTRKTMPLIMGYSSLAATAGAVPVPIADAVLVSGIQSKMIHAIAQVYNEEMDTRKFLKLASALGLGLVARQAGRSLLKLIPFVGTYLGVVTGAALAGASTYALGKAFNHYCLEVEKGHVPSGEELKKWYAEELDRARQIWSARSSPVKDPAG